MTGFGLLGVGVEILGGVATISVSGEIDPFSAPQLRSAVCDTFHPGVSEILLDMSGVTFIDARGYDTVVEVGACVRESGREMRISGRSTSVIRIEQLVAVLDRYPAEAAATANMARGVVDPEARAS